MIGLFTWIPVLKKSSCGGRVERDECGLYVSFMLIYVNMCVFQI